MPIIYRARTPSFSSDTENELENIAPTPIDADDSIVLSDLVRTGEASRLRRRGAMRLDHGAPNPPRSSSPTVVVVASPTWESEVEDREGAGPVFSRNSRYSRGTQRESRRTAEDEVDEFRYTIICGGEESDDDWEADSETPWTPSVLPLYPPSSSAPPRIKRRSKRTNGCGAVLHMRAAPRHKLSVWTAKSEALGTVISMEPTYFDRAAVAKIARSACGCIREGVGCAVCGNPLGTRYKPCKTAGDGIFTARPKPSGPLRPEGPRYWHGHGRPPSYPAQSTFYVYTFFSTSVSSYPSYTFPPRPPTHAHPQPLRSYTQPAPQPLFDRDNDEPNYGNTMLDRYMTASPAPLSDTGDEDREREPYRGGFIGGSMPSYIQTQGRLDFDPDGEFIVDGEPEPNSPDKIGEAMLFPER